MCGVVDDKRKFVEDIDDDVENVRSFDVDNDRQSC